MSVTVNGNSDHDDFELAQVDEIVVFGGNGADTIQIDADLLRTVGGLDGSIERGTNFDAGSAPDTLTIVGGGRDSQLELNSIHQGTLRFDGFEANGIDFSGVNAIDDLTTGGARTINYEMVASTLDLNLNDDGEGYNGFMRIYGTLDGSDTILPVRLSSSFTSLAINSIGFSTDLIVMDSIDSGVFGAVTLRGEEGDDRYEVSVNGLTSSSTIVIEDEFGADSLRVFGSGGDETTTVTSGLVEIVHGWAHHQHHPPGTRSRS